MPPDFQIKYIYHIADITLYIIIYTNEEIDWMFSTVVLMLLRNIELLSIFPFCDHYCIL